MLRNLAVKENEYDEVSKRLSDPEIFSRPDRMKEEAKRESQLKETVELGRKLRRLHSELAEARDMARGEEGDLKAMAEEECARLDTELRDLARKVEDLLAPRDPLDDRDALLEVRA